MTESEARAIQSMSVDELEAEMLPANQEAMAHAGCGEKAACRIRAVSIADRLLDEWKSRHTTPVAG